MRVYDSSAGTVPNKLDIISRLRIIRFHIEHIAHNGSYRSR